MLSVSVLGFLVIGVLLGSCVGILPGLGGATTIALLIPFVLPLESSEAIALLIGVAAVAATTGDVTSIVFGIPGEATSAATVVDGHPLARQGQAEQAVGAALGSSLVGSLFGGMVLAASIPLVAPILRQFGSPELFMAAVLGVSFVVPVSGHARLQGLIGGGLGVCLATVGLDPSGAVPRFTGGQLFLWDGVGLIPTALGLFAIPEIVRLGADPGSRPPVRARAGRRAMLVGFAAVVTHWRLVLRCSAIGAVVGLLPGMGASVSQWVAYGHAVRSSRPQRPFGQGAIEGVIGPASANNATLGGALVPTLALGVPASLSAAMLLSALIVKGLQPGPAMLLPESQGGHLGLVLSLVWLMVVGNLLAVSLCLAGTRWLVKVTRVPGTLLVPFVLLLTLLGAFAEKNAVGNLFVTASMGGLGLIMVRLGWPRVPLMLGLILGSLAETRFFLSMDAYGTSWLLRPGVLVIAALMALSHLLPARNRTGAVARAVEAETPPEPSRAWLELGFVSGVILFLALGVVLTTGLPARAALFPRLVLMATLVLAVMHWTRSIHGTRALRFPRDRISWRPTGTGPVIAGWIVLFVLGIWLLGFVVGAPLATLMYLLTTARQASWRAVLGAGGAYVFVEFVVVRGLRISFPPGSLLEWTGLLNRLSWA